MQEKYGWCAGKGWVNITPPPQSVEKYKQGLKKRIVDTSLLDNVAEDQQWAAVFVDDRSWIELIPQNVYPGAACKQIVEREWQTFTRQEKADLEEKIEKYYKAGVTVPDSLKEKKAATTWQPYRIKVSSHALTGGSAIEARVGCSGKIRAESFAEFPTGNQGKPTAQTDAADEWQIV